jgi:hypothetical protein
MGKKLYPTETIKQAQSILSAWQIIDPALKIGKLTQEAIAADAATVQGLKEKMIHLQNELLDLCHQRDAVTIESWNSVKRARSGITGIYGDDSTAYKLAGGTPRSERRKPRRRSFPDSPENEGKNSQ